MMIPKGQWKWIIGANYFNLMDALITLYMVQDGAHEINPLMRFLLTEAPWSMLVIKVLAMALVTSRCINAKRWWPLKGITFGFCLIVLWNVLSQLSFEGLKLWQVLLN